MKLTEVLANIIDEAKPSKDLFNGLTIENGGVKLWNYSDKKITDGVIRPGMKQGIQSSVSSKHGVKLEYFSMP